MSKTKKPLMHYVNELLKCVIMGIFIGVIIALYKYAVSFVIDLSLFLFDYNNLVNLGVGILVAFSLIFISAHLLMREGSIQGSGWAQLELNMAYNKKTLKWYFAIPYMFLNSLVTFFVGIPLGEEGPNVFMGGVTAIALKRVFHSEDHEDIALGMGAGFGAALLSPLSGIAFTFEEGYERFSWSILLKTIIVGGISFAVSYLMNPHFLFEFDLTMGFNWSSCYWILLVFFIITPIAILLLYAMKKVKTFLNIHYKNFFVKYRYIFVYCLSLVVLIAFPLLSGAGELIIEGMVESTEYSVYFTMYWVVILFLLYRIVVFIIAGNSMASGGLAIPMFVLGALIGCLICFVLEAIPGYDSTQNTLVIVVSMVTMFSIMNKTPITGFFLILSFGGIGGLLTTIFPAIIMTVLVYFLTRIMKTQNLTAIFRSLLRTSRTQNKIDH